MTLHLAKVLRALLDDGPWWGVRLSYKLGIESGTMHSLLIRLEAEGLIGFEAEAADPAVLRRPLRRYCQLTALGRQYAEAELAVLSEQLRPPAA